MTLPQFEHLDGERAAPELVFPPGYCLYPNGAMCVPEGEKVAWDFGYECGYRDAMGVKIAALAHQDGQCDKAPEGWVCTRGAGHEGSCAAVPVDHDQLTKNAATALHVAFSKVDPMDTNYSTQASELADVLSVNAALCQFANNPGSVNAAIAVQSVFDAAGPTLRYSGGANLTSRRPYPNGAHAHLFARDDALKILQKHLDEFIAGRGHEDGETGAIEFKSDNDEWFIEQMESMLAEVSALYVGTEQATVGGPDQDPPVITAAAEHEAEFIQRVGEAVRATRSESPALAKFRAWHAQQDEDYGADPLPADDEGLIEWLIKQLPEYNG